METSRALDLRTGEYAFRMSGDMSDFQAVSTLVDGGELRLYEVAGPEGRTDLEVVAVPGATPLGENEVGTVFRPPGGDPVITLEDRNWTRSYALHDAVDGGTVATTRKSWYAFGPVEVSGPEGDHRATVRREGLLPALGDQPKSRVVTTPDGGELARLDHARVEDAPGGEPREKWAPRVTVQSSGLPVVIVLGVLLGISESVRRGSNTGAAGDSP